MSDQPTQPALLQPPAATPTGPVTCLGLTFASDAERRAHFTALLAEKLKDPAFRQIEGFPIGADEDILALSDPPYYTACPNPWIGDFITEWEALKPPKPPEYVYHREPFAADVSEGKYDPIYRYHPYPTKVPHKAIMRYLLQYTEPGDIVFDGFSGTGMTGVAAQLCGESDVVMSLGYQVKPDGTVLSQDIGGNGIWQPFSHLGARRVVLNDLSPAAAYIAYNYNVPPDTQFFDQKAQRIIDEIERKCGWMYETKSPDGRIGKINYAVWSDVFICPICANEVIFWETAVNKSGGYVEDEFPCIHCGARLTKRNLERAWTTQLDAATGETIRQARQTPVLINYTVDGKRSEKFPDAFDLELIRKIDGIDIDYWYPTLELPKGKKTDEPIRIGVSRIHHFYSKRNLSVLALLRSMCTSPHDYLLITKVSMQITKLYRFTYQSGVWGAGGGPLSGTLYIPSLIKELNIISQIRDSLRNRLAIDLHCTDRSSICGNQSSTSLSHIPTDSIDYIFLDPPFGANLNYSELAILWESWLRIWTDNKFEAIENDVQGKGPNEYRQLMTECFMEAYRVLRPGRWMTVEFSNTKASVWNSIQIALSEAGFIVANVSALDKKKGSFNAVTSPTAVRQDLVISAYKPNIGFDEFRQIIASSKDGVWGFIRTHLHYLPIVKRDPISKQRLVAIPERDARILYDQMVAFYVRNGYPIPLDSHEFQAGLDQRFSFRDGMYFLPEQVVEYDKKRLMANGVEQAALFVSDESSAIAWLRQLLRQKPQTFQDINPQFMKELGGWSKNEETLELSTLLEQNFLIYDGSGPVPEQIHAYLSSNWREYRGLSKNDPELIAKARNRWYVPDPNKATDLEKLREKALLKEFDDYRQIKKKLKLFRLEAVRAGFKRAWQARDYATIIAVAEKIPEDVLQEDPKLLMWYDQALTRTGVN